MRSAAMDEFVGRVEQGSDIVEVVSHYVRLTRKGGRFWGLCPFHQEQTPSFSVAPDKGFFYCFGCHAGGNVFKFLSLIENVSYFEAIKLQAEKLGIPMPERQRSAAEEARARRQQDLLKVNEMAKSFFHNCLTQTRYGEAGKAYLAGRGISEATIEEFSLGYAPDAWDKLSQAFQKRGVRPEYLLAAGLSQERREGGGLIDRFRHRVMIPIADERGRVVGFGGRVLDGSLPKYLNTKETALFNKRRLLFGLDRARRAIGQTGYALVVEGYMDAIAVFDAGIQNVVASLGTAFTPEHCRKLLRYAPTIYFCYDSDAAGQNATIRALALAQGTGAEVRVVVVPDGKDPDEYIRKHGAAAFKAVVQAAQPLFDYRLRHVLHQTPTDTLTGKRQALQAMLPVLLGIRDAAERDEQVKRLARELFLDEGTVREELAKARRQPQHAWRDSPAAHRGSSPAQAEPAPQKPVQRASRALQAAGRTVIRAIWQDPTLLAHASSLLPFAGLADEPQRAILGYLAATEAQGLAFDASAAAEALDEVAAEELSRALVEEDGAGETAVAYYDSLKRLRLAYLDTRYEALIREEAELRRAGDTAAAEAKLREAREVSQSKAEMDG